jgi:hypothetical protein
VQLEYVDGGGRIDHPIKTSSPNTGLLRHVR